jgi:hypothetical protein
MSALAAPAPARGTRMSLWTAFWALLGGGIVGLLAAALVFDPVQYALGLDAAARPAASVWQPFPPVGAPARAADLTTFAIGILFCGLAARRISRTPQAELSLPAAAAAVAAIALIAAATRSWWCLVALVPVAAALRLAARAPGPRSTWRRRIAIVSAGVVAYAAVTGLALADLQRHPLAASAEGTCGVQGSGGGRITTVCLEVVNLARGRTATVLGVAAGDLPRPSPWRFGLKARSIRPRRDADLLVRVRTSCAGLPAGAYTLGRIPLRVRAAGDTSTAAIATPVVLTKTCS